MVSGRFQEETPQHVHCTQEKLSRLIHVGLTTGVDTVEKQKDFLNKKARLKKDGSVIVWDGYWTYNEIEEEEVDQLINNYFQFKEPCSTTHDIQFKNSPFIKDLEANFDRLCKGKTDCEIPLNLNLLDGTKCYDYVTQLRGMSMLTIDQLIPSKNMQFQIISLCKSANEIKLLGTNTKITRRNIHLIAIYTEIISIIVFIVYISCLDYV